MKFETGTASLISTMIMLHGSVMGSPITTRANANPVNVTRGATPLTDQGWFRLYNADDGNEKAYNIGNSDCFTYGNAAYFDWDHGGVNDEIWYVVQFATSDRSCQLPIACVTIIDSHFNEPFKNAGLMTGVDADYHIVQTARKPPYDLCTMYK